MCTDLLDTGQGFVLVPDNPGVGFAYFGGAAEQCKVLTDGCCR